MRPGSTVGGVLATAASGRERLRSGAVRDSLLQVVVATGDGRLVTAGGRTVKGVSGFDIPRLAVGSLGTLGVIVQATLKLWPLPPARGWFGAEAPARRAPRGRGADPRRPACARPACCSRPGASPSSSPGRPTTWSRPRASGRWTPRRPRPRATARSRPGVSPARLGALCARLEDAGLDYEARMGVGTCLVGVGSAADVARVRAWAVELGGHAVVTDGDDALRADPWGPEPPGLPIMRRMRDAFDPAGILNRRQLLWT